MRFTIPLLLSALLVVACTSTGGGNQPDPGPSKADLAKAAAKAATEAVADAKETHGRAVARRDDVAKRLGSASGKDKARLTALAALHASKWFAAEPWAAAEKQLAGLEKIKDVAKRTAAGQALAKQFGAAADGSTQAEAALLAAETLALKKAEYEQRYGGVALGANPALQAAEKGAAAGQSTFDAGDYAASAAAREKAAADYAAALTAAAPLAAKKADDLVIQLNGLSGNALLTRAAQIPPALRAQPALAKLASDKGFARLVVEGKGAVSIRALDAKGVAAAEAAALGSAPLDFAFLPAGTWRVEIGEIWIPYVVAAKATLTVRTADAPAGMSLVPAASGLVAKRGPRDFWIGRAEVSQEQYRAYIEATGAPAPPSWIGRKPAVDGNLPVSALRWDESFYYALWAGGRLAYRAEYQRAATAGTDRPYPWGSDLDNKKLVVAPADTTKLGPIAPAPVGGRPEGASPYNVRDLVGNIGELLLPGDPTQAGKIQIAGGSFVQGPDLARLTSPAQVGDRDRRRFGDAGVRVVRSALVAADGSPITATAALADKALEKSAPGVVIEALRQSAVSGAHAALWGKLSSERDLIRRAAGFYLVTSKGGRAYLETRLKDGDAAVRRSALGAIASSPASICDDLLVALAKDADAGLRKAAFQRLGGPPRKRFVATYAAGLADADPAVRTSSLNSLVAFPDETHVAAVRAKLKDSAPEVQGAAIFVLCAWRRGEAADEVLTTLAAVANQQKVVNSVLPMLGLLGPQAVIRSSRKMLNDPKSKGLALMLLGRMGSVQDTGTLLAALSNQQTASLALTGLLDMRTDRANQALTNLITNPGVNVQTQLAIGRTLSQSRHVAAVPKLIELIGRQQTPMAAKGQFILMVGNIGGQVAQRAVAQAMSEQSSPIRNQVATLYALARSGHPQARQQLGQLLQRVPANQRLLIVTAIALTGDPQVKKQLVDLIKRSPVWGKQLTGLAEAMGRVLSREEVLAMLRNTKRLPELMTGALSVGEYNGALDPKAIREILAGLPVQAQIGLMSSLQKRRLYEHAGALESLLKQEDLHPNSRNAAMVVLEQLLRVKNRVTQGGKR